MDNRDIKELCGINRILMTADTIGGIWTYALELAEGLGEHGTEVVLATMGKIPSRIQRAEAERVGNITLRESSFKLEWMQDPREDVARAGEWLLSLEQENSPEIIHLNGYVHALLPWSSSCLVVAHSCVLSWWKAVKKEPLPDEFHWYRDQVRAGLAAADLVVAPTSAMLDSLELNYLPLPDGRVIHNARSLESLVPGKKENIIISAGRIWDEGKNISAVAEAARSLPWPVVVAGEERHPEGEARALANVQRLGMQSSEGLAWWLQRASVFALPARYEPFGLSVLEAAKCGCALVLGDIPTLRELWDGAAVFIDPEDGEALGHALRELCARSWLLELMAAKAYERSAMFNRSRMVTEYLQAYQSIIPGFRSPRTTGNGRKAV